MLIYNTLTRKKEEFIPLNSGKATVYACGPTVYNLIHLGNARQICVFDVIRRYLKFRGYDVLYVQNFTDVDDRIIKLANEKGITPSEYSESMIREYFTDARALNVLDADIHPKVTENIPLIIDIINVLLEKGFAYRSGGDVYFTAEKFPGYGKLSRNTPEELREGASNRLDAESENKRSPLDFALWKAAKNDEPYWEAPFGNGRPGWHIECSAMSRHYIGDTIDIHGGGADLIFPHHENEIAQSEAATGCALAKYWAHNGMLNIGNVKMAKSKNNFFLVREAAEKYGYEAIRFMLLSAHYRSRMNYTDEVLESAVQSTRRLRNCVKLMDSFEKSAAGENAGAAPSESARETVSLRRGQFITAMDDDFNTADGMAALFELVRDINAALSAGDVSPSDVARYRGLFDEINGVLGLVYAEEEKIPEEVTALAEKRSAAKKAKDYALADKIREEIGAKGYIIEETRQGFSLKKKKNG
ncbi:MAG: cysteine--tRNA ligase [Oscillospiraceae bacterium]|jgi:cysteinyl-tRNA synthetase|nr:cysteine--tRNA ligase [Oscillospiraceae bacterium]